MIRASMTERRGHRKLRLCTKKHYETKKYFPKKLLVCIPRRTVTILKVSLPIDLVRFRVSLPLSAYTNSPVTSLDILHHRLKQSGAIPQEWTLLIQDEVFSLCQLCNLDTGPEIMLSLTIAKDFSWNVNYKHQLVDSKCSALLKDLPSLVNSVSRVSCLIDVLSAAKVCEGNREERFLNLQNIHKGVLKNHSRTEIVAKVDSARTGILSIYHVNCEILIQSSSECNHCTCCKKYRKTLSAMAARPQKDERSHPSSHTTYACLHTPEKTERLSRLHQEGKIAKLHITRLIKKLTELVDEDGICLDDELDRDLKTIVDETTKQVNSNYLPDSFQQLFWQQQQKAISMKDVRAMKWHPLFIKWCLYLRHLSGKSYELLRDSGCIKLPSQRTLRDYTHYIPSTIGFSGKIDQDLVNVANLAIDVNKYVGLIMDEVHIKHELVYDKHEGCLIGFVNLGETNNQLIEFEAALSGEEYQRPLATSMLVFMVRGFFQKLHYPYAQFACSNLTGDLLFNPVWEAISRLERIGFHVLTLTCDGASSNRRLWKLHSKADEVIYKVPNPFALDSSRYLYFISDPPHLLKTIRNSWYNTKRHLWCNGKEISWKHLEELYLKDTDTVGLRLVPKLKYEHIYLTTFSKMRVDLAAQVLSQSVATALELSGKEEYSETIKFVEMIDHFFDCFNVNNYSSGKHKRKPFQDPFRKGDFRLKWLEEEFLSYLKEWETSVEQRKEFSPKAKTMMLLTKETRLGITVNVKSFVELVRYLFTIPGVTSFLSEKLSQDPLEKFFGCQRQRGGTSENPNVQQFCKNSQALRVVNSVCGHVPRGNCRGHKESINWEQENRPLAKRHKSQPPKTKNGSGGNMPKKSEQVVTVLKTVSEKANKKQSNSEENLGYGCCHGNELAPPMILSTDEKQKLLLTESKKLTKEQSNSEECLEDISRHSDDHDLAPLKVLSTDNKQKLSPYAEEISCIAIEVPPTASPINNNQMNLVHSCLQKQRIDQAIGPGPADEVLSTGYHICLKRHDFQLLSNGKWLNDKVINFYLRLVAENSTGVCSFSTFFYTKLSSAGYSGVHNWIKDVDLFSMQLLLIPIHLETHWCLATIDFTKKQFCYYDSLKGKNLTCLEYLRQYLQQESLNRRCTQYTFSEWSNIFHDDIPEQYNSSDCGIFLCMYARKLSEHKPFVFTQHDIPAIRRHMALELLDRRLL